MKITEIMKLSAEIQNFYDCYDDIADPDQLYARGYSDGKINPEDLLVFLLDNPHMMRIAQRINELRI